MEIRYSINTRVLVLAIIGATMVVFSYFIFVYDPLQLLIKKLLTLSPGTLFFSIWSKPPYEVLIKVYIFNITNQQAFEEGTENLTYTEIGPYVYQEILTNENAVFNDNGTITFHPRRDLIFRRDYSVGDSKEDRFISVNVPLVGITSAMNDASMFTSMGIASISSFVGAEPFLNLSVHDYLWGYEDNLVTLANQYIPSWIDFDKFGILDRLMAKDNASNVVTILTDSSKASSQNPLLNEFERKRMYHIERYNGFPGLRHWGYIPTEGNKTLPSNTRCNNLEGVFEGTLFPPNMAPGVSYGLYRPAFCRPVPTSYDHSGYTTDGLEAYYFRVDENFLGTPEENPDNACYCPKSGCLRKGLGSLAPCYYDIPIVISQPHFYNSDPWLLQQVAGLKPNKTLHDTTYALHPKIGIPLEANLRIQININVGETRFNALTEPFNNKVLPLFWLEMTSPKVPTPIVLLVKVAYQIGPVVQTVMAYLLAIVGLGLISGSALLALFYPNNSSRDGPMGPSYSPIPVIPMRIPAQYLRPSEIRICK